MSDATNSGDQDERRVEEPATAPAESAAAEPHDTDPEVADPPSGPVSARGHVNRPAADGTPSTPSTLAAAQTPAPTPLVEPTPAAEAETADASEDAVAAAVARNTAEPGAVAAGSATVDTASPAESATPVIVAAEAANLASGAANTAAYAAPVAGQGTWASEPTANIAPQPVAPIFIQRPEPPKKRSNRGFGILIALVGTVVFAVLWAAAVVLIGLAIAPSDEIFADLLEYFTRQLSGWAPIVAFFVGMVVLIQIVNRSRWWTYILGGLFVAALVYFVYIGAGLVDARYWERNTAEVDTFLRTVWLNPFAVVAAILAREMSIWTGAWLAARGRRLKARNAEAQADYEQQLADAQNQAVAAYAQQGY